MVSLRIRITPVAPSGSGWPESSITETSVFGSTMEIPSAPVRATEEVSLRA